MTYSKAMGIILSLIAVVLLVATPAIALPDPWGLVYLLAVLMPSLLCGCAYLMVEHQ